MFRIILAAVLAACSFAAAAETTVKATSDSSSQSSSGSLSSTANQIQINSEAPTRVRYDNRTNTTVALAAATSFSSDYCGGTNSGGASGFGVSIGAAKVAFDEHCQHLRAGEKWGLAATTLRNLGHNAESADAATMMIYELCLASPDSRDGCKLLGLIRDGGPR